MSYSIIIMKKVNLVCLFFILTAIVSANVRLPTIFGNNMVLQRNKPIPIWGWADAGEKITVHFKQQNKTVTAGDKDGKWMIRLDNEAAGGPYQLTITGKE